MATFYQTPTPGWIPSDYSILAWSGPLALYPNSTGPASGTMNVVLLPLRASASITNVILAIQTAGSTLTSGQNFAALYQNGTKIGVTADQSASWVSTGVKTMALVGGPFTVTAGLIQVCWWSVGTTPPLFHRGGSSSANNFGLTGANAPSSTADTGLTTTAPNTLAAQTAVQPQFWVAVS